MDDALILARYAQNLLHHHELAFNLGQRVEGYTSFSWVLGTALLAGLGVSPDRGVVALSLLAGILGAGVVGAAASGIAGPPGQGRAPGNGSLRSTLLTGGAVSAALVLLPSWTCWASSGMESCGFGLLWTASLLAYARAGTPRGWILVGGAATLTALTRPEGVLLPGVIALHEVLGRRRWGRLSVTAGTFLVLFGAYFTWRWSYFGYPLPNTFYAKVGGPSLPLLARGVTYVAKLTLYLSPLLLPALVGWLRLARSGWRDRFRPPESTRDPALSPGNAGGGAGLLALGAAVFALLGILAVGGDHFPLLRFGVPLLPSLVLLVWVGLGWIRGLRARAGTLLLASALANVLAWGPITAYIEEADLAREWSRMGRRLGRVLPPGATLATYFIGAVGYYSEEPILDMLGIVEPHIAHLQRPTGRGYAGHEKYDSAYILARKPEAVLIHSRILSQDTRVESFWGEAANDLFRNPAFRKEYRFQAVPCDGGFIHLFVRRPG